jgi:uncharacterized protein YdhG (YjbR/CyaY superfamily)
MNNIDKIPIRSIDEYMVDVPENARIVLEELRCLVKSIVPMAEETISYQIPTFKYKGMLVGFASFKKHCSFFLMSTAVMEAFSNELKEFKTSKGTLRFTIDKPIPPELVTKLVLARVAENDELAKLKKRK